MTMLGQSVPGIRSDRTYTPREILWSDKNALYLPGGKIIKGTKSRDPLNTGDLSTLRPGMVMGKITSGGLYAPSIIGLLDEAIDATETAIDIPAAVVIELTRRVGATGTFKITGPPTAAGTVRTLTATYSGFADADTVTITALGVADVWTLTAPAGQDGGMYQLEVTTGKGTSAEVVAVTAALAAAANTATVDAAVEALANVGAGNVAAVYSDPTLTLTFSANLGPVHVRVLSDTTNDGGVFEGGWAAVHTTTGVDGRFVTGSLIQPTDGSETPRGILNDHIRVTDVDGNDLDAILPRLLIGGIIDETKIINWPADTSTRAWLLAQLNAPSTGCGPFIAKGNF